MKVEIYGGCATDIDGDMLGLFTRNTPHIARLPFLHRCLETYRSDKCGVDRNCKAYLIRFTCEKYCPVSNP